MAEDVDSALRDSGIRSSLLTAIDMVDGLHCTDKELCDLLQKATGIRYVLDLDETGGKGALVINFGRKVPQK